jgi:hypothetical protein
LSLFVLGRSKSFVPVDLKFPVVVFPKSEFNYPPLEPPTPAPIVLVGWYLSELSKPPLSLLVKVAALAIPFSWVGPVIAMLRALLSRVPPLVPTLLVRLVGG